MHCHTVYSRNGHGKATIEENVKAAIKKNLRRIYITDHGFSHLFFGIKRSLLPKIREEVNRLKKKYPEIEIYLGVEANIIGYDGTIDVTERDRQYLDAINLGWHHGVHFADVKSNCRYLRNLFLNKHSSAYVALMEQNTDAMISAIQKNNILMITHPGDKIPMNMDRLAKACAQTNTLMEINNAHGHLSVEEIQKAMVHEVKFAIGSDAHCAADIGKADHSIQRIIDSGLEIERVVNLEEKGIV